ncbi:MAG: peptidylprolyl isomerase [Chloroflexota bacterium]
MERLESDDRPLAIVDPVERVNLFNTPPEETIIDLEKQYTASILTSKGELTVELFVDEAPISVNNFVVLVELGYFDGLPIALVNPEIVLFGSPDVADPTQDVGYLFEAEKNLSRPLVIGSMAYIPHRDNPTLSSGSQILMALVPPPAGIQSQFSFFAEITEGADILTELTPEDTIESVTITSE